MLKHLEPPEPLEVLGWISIGMGGLVVGCLIAIFLPQYLAESSAPAAARTASVTVRPKLVSKTMVVCAVTNSVIKAADGSKHTIPKPGPTFNGREVSTEQAYQAVKPGNTYEVTVSPRDPSRKRAALDIFTLQTVSKIPAPALCVAGTGRGPK